MTRGEAKRKATKQNRKNIWKFIYGRKFLSIPKAAPEMSRNSHKDINFVLHAIQALSGGWHSGPSNQLIMWFFFRRKWFINRRFVVASKHFFFVAHSDINRPPCVVFFPFRLCDECFLIWKSAPHRPWHTFLVRHLYFALLQINFYLR